MNTQKDKKTLKLNKKTIVNLNRREMFSIKGGTMMMLQLIMDVLDPFIYGLPELTSSDIGCGIVQTTDPGIVKFNYTAWF